MSSEYSTKIYKKLKLHEHILLRPDTYVGSVELAEQGPTLIVDPEDASRIIRQSVTFSPAFIGICNEIIVNAADVETLNKNNKAKAVRHSDISVDSDSGIITVRNDGVGSPAAKVDGPDDIYAVQMIFGQLLTGSTFDDD